MKDKFFNSFKNKKMNFLKFRDEKETFDKV